MKTTPLQSRKNSDNFLNKIQDWNQEYSSLDPANNPSISKVNRDYWLNREFESLPGEVAETLFDEDEEMDLNPFGLSPLESLSRNGSEAEKEENNGLRLNNSNGKRVEQNGKEGRSYSFANESDDGYDGRLVRTSKGIDKSDQRSKVLLSDGEHSYLNKSSKKYNKKNEENGAYSRPKRLDNVRSDVDMMNLWSSQSDLKSPARPNPNTKETELPYSAFGQSASSPVDGMKARRVSSGKGANTLTPTRLLLSSIQLPNFLGSSSAINSNSISRSSSTSNSNSSPSDSEYQPLIYKKKGSTSLLPAFIPTVSMKGRAGITSSGHQIQELQSDDSASEDEIHLPNADSSQNRIIHSQEFQLEDQPVAASRSKITSELKDYSDKQGRSSKPPYQPLFSKVSSQRSKPRNFRKKVVSRDQLSSTSTNLSTRNSLKAGSDQPPELRKGPFSSVAHKTREKASKELKIEAGAFRDGEKQGKRKSLRLSKYKKESNFEDLESLKNIEKDKSDSEKHLLLQQHLSHEAPLSQQEQLRLKKNFLSSEEPSSAPICIQTESQIVEVEAVADILLSFSRSVETRSQKATRAKDSLNLNQASRPLDQSQIHQSHPLKRKLRSGGNQVMKPVGKQTVDQLFSKSQKVVFHDSKSKLSKFNFKPKRENKGGTLRVRNRGISSKLSPFSLIPFSLVEARDELSRPSRENFSRSSSLPLFTFNYSRSFNEGDISRTSSLVYSGFNSKSITSCRVRDFVSFQTHSDQLVLQSQPQIDANSVQLKSSEMIPFVERKNHKLDFSSSSSLTDEEEEEELKEKKTKRAKILNSSDSNSKPNLKQGGSKLDSEPNFSPSNSSISNRELENISISNGKASSSVQRKFPKGMPIHSSFPRFYNRFKVPSSLPPSLQVEIFGGVEISEFHPDVLIEAQRGCSSFGEERNEPDCLFDLYTPRFLKQVGKEKKGLCPVCFEEGSIEWFKTKNSAFNYHLQNVHGIDAKTGEPFVPPIAFRQIQNSDQGKHKVREIMTQGKCHVCKKFIDIETTKDVDVKIPELLWWKHAQSCHKKSEVQLKGIGETFIKNAFYDRVVTWSQQNQLAQGDE